MNKKLVVSLCILSGLFLGSLKSFTAEPVKAPAGAKFAVVEVSVVVANSKKVAALQKEQEKKMQDLKKWLETVRADVSKQSTQAAKDKLIKKFLHKIFSPNCHYYCIIRYVLQVNFKLLQIFQ